MIRVELGEERDGPKPDAGRRHGKWHWTVPAMALEGFSRQPLVDACREIKRTVNAPSGLVGLFREGRSEPDLFCTVETGARYTVDERATPRFRKWEAAPLGRLRTKKESTT